MSKQTRQFISGFFVHLSDLLIDPILFVYFLSAIFPRIQSLIEQSISVDDFQILFANDVLMYPFWYIGLGIIFLIWIFYKTWDKSNTRKQDNKIQMNFDDLSNKLQQIIKLLENNTKDNEDDKQNKL
jgi:hypothetical protein